MKALGLIETKGMVGAIVAADAALKTAQVELINREHTKGGMVCIEFEGDVAAVKASVEAGVAAVKEMGVLIGSHVIPRPDDSVELVIKRKPVLTEEKAEEVLEKVEPQEVQKEEVVEEVLEQTVEETLESADLKLIEEEIEEINENLKVSKTKKTKKNKK